jgi:hypothetical protein
MILACLTVLLQLPSETKAANVTWLSCSDDGVAREPPPRQTPFSVREGQGLDRASARPIAVLTDRGQERSEENFSYSFIIDTQRNRVFRYEDYEITQITNPQFSPDVVSFSFYTEPFNSSLFTHIIINRRNLSVKQFIRGSSTVHSYSMGNCSITKPMAFLPRQF